MPYATLTRKHTRASLADMVGTTTWTLQRDDEEVPGVLGWTNLSLLKVFSRLEGGANNSGWKLITTDGENTFILHRP